jgi:hypothetical protein
MKNLLVKAHTTPCHYISHGPLFPSHASRTVMWCWGGHRTCSGTGRRSGVVGPLWVPGLTARRQVHGCPKIVREREV